MGGIESPAASLGLEHIILPECDKGPKCFIYFPRIFIIELRKRVIDSEAGVDDTH